METEAYSSSYDNVWHLATFLIKGLKEGETLFIPPYKINLLEHVLWTITNHVNDGISYFYDWRQLMDECPSFVKVTDDGITFCRPQGKNFINHNYDCYPKVTEVMAKAWNLVKGLPMSYEEFKKLYPSKSFDCYDAFIEKEVKPEDRVTPPF